MSVLTYVVKWNKRQGKYSERKEFQSRRLAVLYLNMLVLDMGVSDAKLDTERQEREWVIQ